MDPERFNWKVLVYGEQGQVVINTVIPNKTEPEIDAWRASHEDESWASVNITKQ